MFAASLRGLLTSGPTQASCEDVPSLVNVAIALSTQNKSLGARTNDVLTLDSPNSFVAVGNVGTGKAVTRATLLLAKAKGPLTLRLTTDDGSGGSVVATVPVSGIFLLETNAAKPVKLVEAQGSGVLEIFAGGPQ